MREIPPTPKEEKEGVEMTTLLDDLRTILVEFALTDRACVADNRDKFDREENLNRARIAILALVEKEIAESKKEKV